MASGEPPTSGSDSTARLEAQHLWALLDALPDIVFELDRTQRYVAFWGGGLAQLGVKPEQFLGKTAREILGPDAAAIHEFAYRRVLAGERISYDWSIDRPTGRLFFRISLAPLRGADGSVVGVVGVARDVTARKRAAESLRFLAEASQALSASLDFETTVRTAAHVAVPFLADVCAVHVLDGERTIRAVAVNDACDHLAGPAEALQRQHVDMRRAIRRLAQRPRAAEAQFSADVTHELLEKLVLNPEHLRLLRALRLRSHILAPIVCAGSVVGSIAFAVCEPGRRYTRTHVELAEALAHRVALALQHAQLYREAQRATYLRDQLLATVAHDVRNELAAVSLTAEALQLQAELHGMPDPARLATDLETIRRAATKTISLMTHLLDVGRLQAGQELSIQPRPCDLVALARRLATEYQPTSRRHRIRVDACVAELVGLWDALRLERVVANLLDNAIKYSPQGGEIVVRVAEVADETGVWAELVVSDQGLGIPASDMPKIFDWFSRGSNVIGRIEGTGVGLASARHIVELHGGTITAANGEAGGATFTIRLPLVEQPSQAVPDTPAQREEAGDTLCLGLGGDELSPGAEPAA